ncbi:MAG: HAD hydrolase-like protein [Anaerolineaceae bacterium]|nr:HAD hydrolase-like protein [Anaerolineaceae bacterium]
MAYKLFIFDFDGTLANSFPWVVAILDELAEKFNAKPVDHSRLEELKNYPPRKIMKMHNISIWKLPAILRFTRSRMKTNSESIRCFEGVESMLQKLKENDIRMALVTTNTCETVRKVLGDDLYNLFHHFEDNVSLFGKPAALKRIIRKSGLDRSEMLAIGDEIRDVEAAKKVNIPFGAVSWGFSSMEAMAPHSPEHIFTEVSQIADLVVSAPLTLDAAA